MLNTLPMAFLIWFAFSTAPSNSPQLARLYEQSDIHQISDYLVSEKYDGIRAIWTGTALVTRQGNTIHAPAWFTDPLPNVWLDGELWTKREDFEALSSIVRSHNPDARWRQVSYQVFDMPDPTLPFTQRYDNYVALIAGLNAPHVQAVAQHTFDSLDALQAHLHQAVQGGAEGLMLHLASARHTQGRSQALLKLKPYYDAEALVIGHLAGRGKYTGMLGALRVRNEDGLEFSVGTGFTDSQRATPPPIGSVITYKYHGYTNKGLPRFTSFLRVRSDLVEPE